MRTILPMPVYADPALPVHPFTVDEVHEMVRVERMLDEQRFYSAPRSTSQRWRSALTAPMAS